MTSKAALNEGLGAQKLCPLKAFDSEGVNTIFRLVESTAVLKGRMLASYSDEVTMEVVNPC